MVGGESGNWWSFATARRVAFGRRASRFLPEAAASLGERVLLCTDRNIAAAGILDPLVEAFGGAPNLELLIFDGGEAEIGCAGVERCYEAVRDFRPAVVVGLGGGSNLDLAKAVAARLLSDRPVASWTGDLGVPRGALPVIAVPTTAGTGSEVTPIAVLTDEDHDAKVGFTSPNFLPAAVLVDPLLTASCPPSVTADSGMDALTHAIEAYLAIDFWDRPPRGYETPGFVGKNPISDALASRAVDLIGANLARAVDNGADLEARDAMALGSLLAGMAFSNAGTAIVHALQYPVGALTKTPHGLGNAILLPSAVRFNLPARTREAAELARILGSSAVGESAAAAELAPLLEQLARSVGIPPGLSSLGVKASDLPALAEAAAGIRRLTDNNPRVADAPRLLEVLQDALGTGPGAPERE